MLVSKWLLKSLNLSEEKKLPNTIFYCLKKFFVFLFRNVLLQGVGML